MINVGIVAGTMAIRVGLREILNNKPGMVVTCASHSWQELSNELMDVLVVVSPIQAASLKNNIAVLYLTDEAAEMQSLINSNFVTWGVLSVNASEEELEIAIHALAEGLWIGNSSVLRVVMPKKIIDPLEKNDFSVRKLTERETEVLQYAAQGLANKQIAQKLQVSEHTIKFHLSSLYAKLGVSSRTEAVRNGVRNGLVVL